MTSLNPFLPVWLQIAEVAQVHLGYTHDRARDHAIQMLEDVGIPDARARASLYPHQFSGGMRQRVMHGKDVTIPNGTEITAYVSGDFVIDSTKLKAP